MNGKPDQRGTWTWAQGTAAEKIKRTVTGLWSKRTVVAEHSAAVRLFHNAAAEAQRSKLPQMAAALSYRTIFGLIPVLVVALIALKFFTTDSDMSDLLNRAMQYSGLSSIAVGDSAATMGPFPEDYYKSTDPGSVTSEKNEATQAAANKAETKTEAVVEGKALAVAESSQRLDLWIKELVERVSSINFKAIGLIGLVALIYAAISMLVEVERAFNQIYRVPFGRSWVRRITHYWTLLTLGALGLFMTFYVGQWFTNKLVEVAARLGANAGSTVLLAIIGYFSTATISTLLFLLLYTVVPNTRVKFGPALAGAAIGALAWEAGKWGFTQYVHYSAGYSRLYGSIALIPLFLMWVYLTWCIVLFGLNVAYFLQYGRTATSATAEDDVLPAVVDPAAIVSLVGLMAGRFEKGDVVDACEAAAALRIQQPVVAQMLEKLSVAGIVNGVRREDREGLYALARPADRIDAEEVLKLGDELVGQAKDGGPIAAAMRRAQIDLVHGKTVAQLLGTDPEPNQTRPVTAPLPGGRPIARPATG